jgi:hypothetical protein
MMSPEGRRRSVLVLAAVVGAAMVLSLVAPALVR